MKIIYPEDESTNPAVRDVAALFAYAQRYAAAFYGLAAAALVVGWEIWREHRNSRVTRAAMAKEPSGLMDFPRWVRWLVYEIGIAVILVFGNFGAQPFIYFQF
jgi:hypothetical protein